MLRMSRHILQTDYIYLCSDFRRSDIKFRQTSKAE